MVTLNIRSPRTLGYSLGIQLNLSKSNRTLVCKEMDSPKLSKTKNKIVPDTARAQEKTKKSKKPGFKVHVTS